MNKTLKIKKKGNEGITLIALVITIIVLIILAGITINLLMGDNGILTRAKGAKEEFNKSKMLEDTTLMLMDYSAEHELTGITLKDYLTKNNISFEEDGINIKFVEEGYELTVNPITLELDGPTKSNKTAKITLSSNEIEQNGTLTVTLTFGEDVDVANCKYKFAKASETVEKEDVTTAISGTTVNIASTETAQKGEYYLYLLVAYKNSNDTVLKKAKVTVGIPVTGVALNKTSLTLDKGDTETLQASVLPSNAVQGVDWSTSDSSIVTVNNSGLVTAVTVGTARITATSTDDTTKTAICTVTVPVTLISGITLPENVTIAPGQTTTLSPTFTPANPDNTTLTWTSNNTSVATVNQSTGKITGVTAGTAVITATSTDGSNKSNSTTITVSNPVKLDATDVYVSRNDNQSYPGSNALDGDNETFWYFASRIRIY